MLSVYLHSILVKSIREQNTVSKKHLYLHSILVKSIQSLYDVPVKTEENLHSILVKSIL